MNYLSGLRSTLRRVIDVIASTLYVTISENSNPKGLFLLTPSQGATPIHPIQSHPIHGKGKKLCWAALNCLPDMTETFVFLQDQQFEPLEKGSPQFEMLERFTVVIKGKTSSLICVNNPRRELFTKQNRMLECIPPTQVGIKSFISQKS